MPEEVKFTEDELKQVESIQKAYHDVQNQFGQLKIAKIRLEQQIKNLDSQEGKLNDDFISVQDNERKFLDNITEKYGEGSLNPETGVFTPNT